MIRWVFFIVILLLTCVGTERSHGVLPPNGAAQRVTFVAAAMDFSNPDYLGPGAYVRVSRKNRKSGPALNALFPFLVDLEGSVSTAYEVYQRIDNKWKETVFKGSADMCEALQSKIRLYRIFYNYSNFPNRCPVVKGNYTVTDFRMESMKDGLPLIPASEGKVRLSWSHKNINFMSFWFEVKIDHW